MTGGRTDLLLTWYGDDFSGSTDVMEALARNGIPSVLFLKSPSDQQLALFPGVRAVGIAGVSRSQSPEWMSHNLPPIFERLKQLHAPIVHYKVCSTFDSSPEVGSIGRALDIGQNVFGNKWSPLVVGAPALRRYTLFGNLFATVDGIGYRLDRHPTMSRHPVTPMKESDLREHLSLQTQKHIGLLDILALQSGDGDRTFKRLLSDGAEVILFDVLDEASLSQIGRIIWQRRAVEPMFAVGSSGLEYALAAWWRDSGEEPVSTPRFTPRAVDRVAVVSGSCSPVTEAQIHWALANGFDGIPINAAALVDGVSEAYEEAMRKAEMALQSGRSALIYTALGPSGPMMLNARTTPVDARHSIGIRLGNLLRDVLQRTGVSRAVVAGGDTSGHAAQQLDIAALQMVAPLAPGSPLCHAHCEGTSTGDLEIVFKGGQVGPESFFGMVRAGG